MTTSCRLGAPGGGGVLGGLGPSDAGAPLGAGRGGGSGTVPCDFGLSRAWCQVWAGFGTGVKLCVE